MMRSIKVFGLVLVAALAMSAVAASASSASYDAGAEETILAGVQGVENTFTTDVGNVKCKKAEFNGTQVQKKEKEAGVFTSETITVQPTYNECNLAGQSVEVKTTGCSYTFHPAETLVTKGPPEVKHLISKVTLECEAGKKIIIKDKAGLGCEVTVGPLLNEKKEEVPQKLERVKFTNEGEGASAEVLVTAEVSAIAYAWTKGCPNAKEKAGSNTNGTYSGTVKVKGTNKATGKQVNIKVTMKVGE